MASNREQRALPVGSVLVWVAALISLGQTAMTLIAQRGQAYWAGDLPAYLVGWRLAAKTGPLYDLEAQRLMAGSVLQRAGSVPACPFNYPPHLAVLGRVLPPMTYQGVLFGWFVTSALMSAVLAVMWARSSRYAFHVGAAVIIGSPAIAKAVTTGSILPFAAAGALLAVVGIHREGHKWMALSVVGWFAVATKPHLAIVLALACLMIKPIRSAKTLAVASVPIVGIPTIVFGPRVWTAWLSFLSQFSRSTEADLMCRVPRTSPNIEGLLTRAGMTPSLALTWASYVIAVAALLTWVWFRRPTLVLACTVGAALVPLTAPHANPQDLLLCLPFLLLPANGSKTVATGWAVLMSLAMLSGGDLFTPAVQIGVVVVLVASAVNHCRRKPPLGSTTAAVATRDSAVVVSAQS
jgi:hypothetical protein